MENQVPEEVVKDRFDRLLAQVQEIARERSSRFEGTRTGSSGREMSTIRMRLCNRTNGQQPSGTFPGRCFYDWHIQTDSSGRMQGILLYGNACRIENVTVHSDFYLNIIE